MYSNLWRVQGKVARFFMVIVMFSPKYRFCTKRNFGEFFGQFFTVFYSSAGITSWKHLEMIKIYFSFEKFQWELLYFELFVMIVFIGLYINTQNQHNIHSIINLCYFGAQEYWVWISNIICISIRYSYYNSDYFAKFIILTYLSNK